MPEQSYFITIPSSNERWDMPEYLVNQYWEYLKGLDPQTRKEKYHTAQEEWFHSLSSDDQNKIKKSKAY